jgi:glutathione S-transferase
MNYTLIGSLTSPYVRKIRLVIHGLDFQLKVVNYLEETGNDYLKSVNPVNKLPVLMDGEKVILDSRIIYYYLAQKNHWAPLTLDEENILTAIDGAMDTSISLFSLKRGGLDLESGNSYVQRQIERVPHILNFLSPWVKTLDEKNPKHWNFLSMSLYSYLYWVEFRGMYNLQDHPVLKEFLEKFKDAPGVVETTIPA